MRLIFVNRFYWPETPATGQLLTDLAESLATQGHEVTVITSAAAGEVRAEVRRGVRIHRVRGTRWASAGLPGKAADFATFYVGAAWQVLRHAKRETTVVAMTDPPLLGVGVSLAAGMRGAKVVHWVQDIYPEVAIALAGASTLRLLKAPRNAAWRRAERSVTLGDDMAGVLLGAGVPAQNVVVVPNWAPPELSRRAREATTPLRAAWGLNNKFVVAYSGNLGRVHDLEPMLALAEALQDTPDVAFLFVGEGAQRARLEQESIRRRLTNVSFQRAQPRNQLAESLAVADLHVVTLRPGCERFVFPSKVYGIAAVGRPQLFIGPQGCEVARIIRARQLGHCITRDDTAAGAAFVRRLAREPQVWAEHADAAARFAAEHAVSIAVRQWTEVLSAVHACGADAGRR